MKNDKVLKINYLKVVALSAICNDLEGIIFGSSGEKRKMQSLGKAALTRNAKVQKMRIKNRTPGRQVAKKKNAAPSRVSNPESLLYCDPADSRRATPFAVGCRPFRAL
ncbi:hypothetical protein C943_01291 [Mariniradius saccharolyticus AK6]|uniref:Uncharacterized protein n=1 Tax=Mariniradius saccharolyticus AK6 TaxID=1239962 RepID=M7XCG5_9BACT|nr:hypothetical protein C943_01291 [Mariniradius saccharolyticus AK6]